jgi:phosphoribosylcarboxyaminoimidazole (NCAIR) mutase
MGRELLIVQTRASDKDPSLNDQKIGGLSFRDYLREEGIKTLNDGDLVASCHGNTEFSLRAAQQMQALADAGHKVVSIQTGGLYFARPSLEAATAPTVPIISVPLGGLDAFLAANLPAGVAAIGGVSVGNYATAANVAVRILTNEFAGVSQWGYQSSRLEDAIKTLRLPVLSRVHAPDFPNAGILIGEAHPVDFEDFESSCDLGVYSTSVDPAYTMRASKDMKHSVYVRGPENLAYFAAKIVSMTLPDVGNALKEAKLAKSKTYQEPKLTLDAFD